MSNPQTIASASALPVCDHHSHLEVDMWVSLQQQIATAHQGAPVFDLTLDIEGCASPGAEIEQAQVICTLLDSPSNRFGRVGVRLLPIGHRLFADTAGIVLRAANRPAYLICPQPRNLADVQRAAATLDALGACTPLHAVIETHGALHEVFDIAAHPRIESLSFGLAGFVAAHRGAIPASALTGAGQFDHPLVVRAKLEIAAACHAAGKTPTHCAFTDLDDPEALQAAAEMACKLLGYTRMQSAHLAQIGAIVQAFRATEAELAVAADLPAIRF
jgi:citrate lyase subunit beta/citryl-CoA lyase